ncbi:MAG: DUF6714 family protein [Pseudomonas sp.]|jgi:hypothetical protein|uniref:DUF6714 family protein n=1 Tax=Ectopseudomonas mendocina TaxID=300 RepID=UPI0031330B3D
MSSSVTIREVQEAFADAILTSEERVVVSTYDDEGASFVFEGRRWQEIGRHELAMVTACLWFLTPAAICAYLPAFLVASLEEPRSGIADATISFIIPPKNNNRRPSFMAWWSLLSRRQQSAVVAFLRVMPESVPNEYAEAVSALDESCAAR